MGKCLDGGGSQAEGANTNLEVFCGYVRSMAKIEDLRLINMCLQSDSPKH